MLEFFFLTIFFMIITHVKSQRRWNLSFETVFGAASYLDRFISLNNCQVIIFYMEVIFYNYLFYIKKRKKKKENWNWPNFKLLLYQIELNLQGWSYWMFELLSIACLSVASKFHETSPPQLLELQVNLGDLFIYSFVIFFF